MPSPKKLIAGLRADVLRIQRWWRRQRGMVDARVELLLGRLERWEGELLGDGPVDLLKMDIEGAECDVLAGQDAALARVKRVFVEYHSYAKKPQRLDELLALFRRAGFRVQIHPELISPRPFVARADEDGMDHRLNIYAWRE
jgi:hypothetical protein